MSIIYPTFEELAEQIRAEFRTQLPALDPTVFGSWALSLANGNAVLAQALTFIIRDLETQMFPQTATDIYLEQWGEYENLTRNPAVGASGYISLPDSVLAPVTTSIPALTEFTGSNGVVYTTNALATIIPVSQAISTITRSGTTATATLASDHTLATGMTITISGATQAEYNGAFAIIVTGANTFTYTVTGTPATPATGSPVYALNMASIPVTTSTTGEATNMLMGAQLINATYGTALVQYGQVSGGADLETDEYFRARIMLSRALISGVFTPDQVKLAALGISGNTRVYVKKPTVGGAGGAVDPAPGQVSVFVLRDNDSNIIPSASVLAATKQAIIDNGKKPANTAEDDIYVSAPTLVETDFEFSALSPDTSTMRAAVEENLAAFFQDSVEFEVSVTMPSFLGAIQNTQDLETGAFITSFTLDAPAADITIAAGEIAALGTITWS